MILVEVLGVVVVFFVGVLSGLVVILFSELMFRTFTFDVFAGDVVNLNGVCVFCVDLILDDVDVECVFWVFFDFNDVIEGVW